MTLQALKKWIDEKRLSGYKFLGYPVHNVQMADLKKMQQIAIAFGFPVEWLANLINFETAGTWNPAIKNNLGYVGLIQFGRAAAQEIGTTQEALQSMSFSRQLDYVAKYLKESFQNRNVLSSNGKVPTSFTQEDLFMTIFYPAAVGNPNFQFPASVVSANNGISTPRDYTERAVRKSFPAFTPPTTPASISSYIAKYGTIAPSFISGSLKWWVIPASIVIFGTLTALAVYSYKQRAA